MNGYRAIIFDLGNVVFNCSFDSVFNYWAKVSKYDESEIKKKFIFDERCHQFEKGEIEPTAFRKYISNKLGLKISNGEFDNGWNRIYLDLVPGIYQLLKDLKPNYGLVALTNTNEIHARKWKIKYTSVLSYFEKIFCSHEIRARKPEQKAYETVLNYLKLNSNGSIFLDDNSEFVKGASDIGIKSILVKSPKQMIAELIKLEIDINSKIY